MNRVVHDELHMSRSLEFASRGSVLHQIEKILVKYPDALAVVVHVTGYTATIKIMD